MSKRHTSLQLLKYADTYTTFHTNDIIFREGEPGKHMFVVKAGTIELRVHEKPIETLNGGDILGEMALLDSESRSATAIAITDCQLVAIDKDRFEYMVRQTPYFAIEVMQVMAKRLRRMNRETSVNKTSPSGLRRKVE